MSYRSIKYLFVCFILGTSFLFIQNRAFAFPVCNPVTNPDAQTFCDMATNPGNFEGKDSGKICVAEPAPPTLGIPPEIEGLGICVSGMVDQVPNLISLFIEVNSVWNPVAVPPRVEIDPNTLTDGTFIETISLPSAGPGLYVAMTSALFIGDMGIPNIVTISREFIKVDEPNLKITFAELKSEDVDLTPNISQDPSTKVYTLTTDPENSESMNLCLANPDGDASGTKVEITVTNEIDGDDEKHFTLTRPCPTPEQQAEADKCAAGEGEEGCDPGPVYCKRSANCAAGSLNGFLVAGIPLGDGINNIEIVVQNSVTGNSPGAGQVIEIAPIDNQLSPPDLCLQFFDQDGDYLPDVDAHIVNADEVTSMMVAASFGACPTNPPSNAPSPASDCDLDIQRICNDFDEDGLLDIDDPDNDNDEICDLPGTEGETYTCADVCTAIGVEDCTTFLEEIAIDPCPSPSAVLCTKAEAGDDSVDMTRACLKKGNELLMVFDRNDPNKLQKKFYEMCPAAHDTNQFIFRLEQEDLKFPLGAITIEAWKEGRKTIKSAGFGYGQMRSRFSDDGTLNRDEVNAALAGHIPTSFLEVTDTYQSPLIDDLEEAMNTDKFKKEFFVKLFKPQAPTQAAIDQCSFLGPNINLFKTFNLFDPTIGRLDITALRLLNRNRVWVRLEIGGLNGYAEVFTLKCQKDDCDGLDIVDNQLQGACFDTDPDTGLGILPIELTVNYLTVNLEIQLSKDANGLTVTNVSNIPGHDLIDSWGVNGRLAKFRCDIPVAKTLDGEGCYDAGSETATVWIDQPACLAMEELNSQLNSSDFSEEDKTKTNMNVSDQLIETIKCQISALTPKILMQELSKFSTEPLTPFTLTVFGKEFTTEIFADLLKADLIFSPRGVSFNGSSLVLPSGAFDEGDPTPDEDRDSIAFMNRLPEALKNSNYGYLADKETEHVNPMTAARHLGKDVNLALKEEMLNMILHGVSTMLVDLLDDNNEPEWIDTNAFSIVDRFGIGATVAPQQCYRIGDDGKLEEVVEDKEKKCFPLMLRVDQVLGGIDLNGDGSIMDEEQSTPLRFRLKLNPHMPPTVQLINSSAIEDADGRPETIILALKVALNGAELMVFEDEVLLDDQTGKPLDPVANLRAQVEEGRKVGIVDWCDRQPEAHPDCTGDNPVPIVTFRLDAQLVVWAQYTPGLVDGKISITAGMKPRELMKQDGEIVIVPDKEASFFNVSVAENNTPYPDLNISGAMAATLDGSTISLYNFGGGNEFALDIVAEFPEGAMCDDMVEEDSFEDLLHDFGFRSIGLEDPVIAMTSGDPRYMAIGFDPLINSCDEVAVAEPVEKPTEESETESPEGDTNGSGDNTDGGDNPDGNNGAEAEYNADVQGNDGEWEEGIDEEEMDYEMIADEDAEEGPDKKYFNLYKSGRF